MVGGAPVRRTLEAMLGAEQLARPSRVKPKYRASRLSPYRPILS